MKKALVLLNMGGPNNLVEVEVFLTNMFNDKNIITVKSDLLRSFIAFMIVTSRKKEARVNYEQLGGKSPLVGYTQKLIDKLQAQIPEMLVTFAMRYTPPFASEVVDQIMKEGVDEVIALPLYPHFSTTTTKSSLEDLRAELRKAGFCGKLKTYKKFYKDINYNTLLAERLIESLGSDDAKQFELIFSAHSLPQKIVDKGDPYQREVIEHAKLIEEILKEKGYEFAGVHVAYQSKLGPIKWLEPSLEDKLKSLTNKNALICPIAFTIDNSETEFELWIEYEEVAEELGFENYRIAKCPNDDERFVHMIKEFIS